MTSLPNITAQDARANRDAYNKSIEKNKYQMLAFWLARITNASKQGHSSILTSKIYTDNESRITMFVNEANSTIDLNYVPIEEINTFFSERGFSIELKKIQDNCHYFIISW